MLDVKNLQDGELVSLMRCGDVTAYTEIYHRYASQMYVMARNATGDAAVAEDIVQEVFVALWQQRTQSAPIVLKGWLLIATRFQVLKTFRHNKSNHAFQTRLQRLNNNLDHGDPLQYRELQRIIPAALLSLPPDQQRIFRLHREDELTYRQIAEQLGVSVKTVEKKMTLALRHLRIEIGATIAILMLV
jgi:RNA polymerase sigma-70 factor, ECF subfamily